MLHKARERIRKATAEGETAAEIEEADLPSPADPSSAAAALPLRRVEAGSAKAGEKAGA